MIVWYPHKITATTAAYLQASLSFSASYGLVIAKVPPQPCRRGSVLGKCYIFHNCAIIVNQCPGESQSSVLSSLTVRRDYV